MQRLPNELAFVWGCLALGCRPNSNEWIEIKRIIFEIIMKQKQLRWSIHCDIILINFWSLLRGCKCILHCLACLWSYSCTHTSFVLSQWAWNSLIFRYSICVVNSWGQLYLLFWFLFLNQLTALPCCLELSVSVRHIELSWFVSVHMFTVLRNLPYCSWGHALVFDF